jgi:hypothetical protein
MIKFVPLRESHRLMGPVDWMPGKFRDMTQGGFGLVLSLRPGESSSKARMNLSASD